MISAVAPINYGNVVSGSNALPTQCNGSYFYARFTGLLVPTVTGLYTIGVNCQDGCNLFVGNQEIVSNVTGMDTALSSVGYTESSTIFLTAGVQYPITSEWVVGIGTYYQLQLIWTLPAGGATELIPNTCLTNLSTSITGNLDSSWWNGTAALYYPGGNGTIDFANTQHANKTLDHIPDGASRSLLGASGSAHTSASADPSIATAPAGDVITSDGAGNVQDGGILLSSLAAKAAYLALAGGTMTGALELATLKDSTGAVGTSGQVLTSTVTGTLWATGSSGGGGGGTGGGGGIYPTMAAPLYTAFTWENQGTSTVANEPGRMVMSIEEVNGLEARGLFQALPSAPYTVTAAFSLMASMINGIIAYIALSDGSTWVGNGALYNGAGSPLSFRRDVWNTNGTGYTGSSGTINTLFNTALVWLRIVDDGINRYFYQSVNGLDWILFLTESNTTTITATSVGLAFYNNGSGNGIQLQASVYDWSIVNSVLSAISTSGPASGTNDPGLLQDVDFTSALGSNGGSTPGYAPDTAGPNPCYITSGNTITSGIGVTTNGSGSYIDTGLCLMGRYLWTVAVKFKTTSNTVGTQYWNDPTIYGMALQANGEDFGMTVHNQYFAAWGGFQDSTDYNAVSSIVVNDANFHTAVATCDGYNVRFYVDGVNAGIDFTSGIQTWLGMRAGITSGGSSQIQRIAPWMGRTNTIDFDGWNNNPPPTGGTNYGGQSVFTFAKLKCWGYALTSAQVASLVL